MKWLKYNIGKRAATLEVGYYWEVVKVIKSMLSKEDNIEVLSYDNYLLKQFEIEIIKVVPSFIEPFVISSQNNKIQVIDLTGRAIKDIVSESYPFRTQSVFIELSTSISPADNLDLIKPYLASLQLWDKDIPKEYEALKKEIENYKKRLQNSTLEEKTND